MQSIRASLLSLLVILPTYGHCDNIQLNLAVRDNYHYISELLEAALEMQGHQVMINGITNLPHKRVMNMLAHGNELSLHWRGQSPKWDKMFTTVEVDLTNGLKGHRVFFIPKGQQSDYDAVQTLDDFKRLGKVGGFGSGWSDVAIWQHNDLPTYEYSGDWNPGLYKMLHAANRGIDYFSRGIIEIVSEAPEHPYLDVEKTLVFIYKKDFRIYLPTHNQQLKPVLERALKAYKNSGKMDQLIRKHFAGVFDKNDLNLDGRRKIYLDMPF
jgi:hypothetical protein